MFTKCLQSVPRYAIFRDMNTTHTPTPAEIIWRQIELGVKMSLGVRKQHSDSTGRKLVMNVGPNNSRYEVTISLNAWDTYDIALTKGARGLVWERTDIYAEVLNEVLLRMESENWG